MIKIQASGEIQPLDIDGYIINTSSLDKIVPPWKEAIEDVCQTYIKKFGEGLHSIYLRGSVPSGKAIDGISDLDSIVIIKADHSDSVDLSWFNDFAETLIIKYPYVSELELLWVNYASLLNPDKLTNVRIQLAIYGLCIYGEDIIPQLPKFKPGRDTIIHAPCIDKQIDEAIEKIKLRDTSDGVKGACTWIMKSFLRVGCELVMEREHVYTRDLYWCYKLFAQYYPGTADAMYQVLDYALNPIDDREKLSSFVKDFGFWLSQEVKAQGLVRK